MWIVELTFTNESERMLARAAHRDRLSGLHRERTVRMAGPLTDDTGALIIIDAPDRRAVATIIDSDPYFTTPGVTVGRIREWAPFLQ
jgi:uncharacterized protein YciI